MVTCRALFERRSALGGEEIDPNGARIVLVGGDFTRPLLQAKCSLGHPRADQAV
jgi:hypothetical protein